MTICGVPGASALLPLLLADDASSAFTGRELAAECGNLADCDLLLRRESGDLLLQVRNRDGLRLE